MSRNFDIVAVCLITAFMLVCSAFSGVAQQPWMQRYDGLLEQRIHDKIEPGIIRIHEKIERSIERSLAKLPNY